MQGSPAEGGPRGRARCHFRSLWAPRREDDGTFLVMCIRCGAYSERKPQRLALPCTGQIPHGKPGHSARSTHKRFFETGVHPEHPQVPLTRPWAWRGFEGPHWEQEVLMFRERRTPLWLCERGPGVTTLPHRLARVERDELREADEDELGVAEGGPAAGAQRRPRQRVALAQPVALKLPQRVVSGPLVEREHPVATEVRELDL